MNVYFIRDLVDHSMIVLFAELNPDTSVFGNYF